MAARFKVLVCDQIRPLLIEAGSSLIIGRKTWQALAEPLVNCIVVSKEKIELKEDGVCAETLDEALLVARGQPIFIGSKGRLLAEALRHRCCQSVQVCGGFFVPIDLSTFKIAVEDSPQCLTYVRKHQEVQYLDLVREIVDFGAKRQDRTGVGTFSVFGRQLRFDLRNNTFPLLTTKRVFWRGVVEELLWFIKGSTDSNALHAKGVNIWDENGSRQFLDSIGKRERAEGDLGPVYGFQWRHFGAKYVDKDANYSGQGFDQLAWVVGRIKSNPDCRRIIMSSWNPLDVPSMALSPCHIMCQFYVANGELSCMLNQRSCDMGLGVPFNIASYALLTCMIAHVCGLVPGEFVHCLGDAHVYSNHVEALREQLLREPRPFPQLRITRQVATIDDFSPDDFELTNYNPHGSIKMKMAC